MAYTEAEAKGPDLAAGVGADEVAEGAMLAGHVGGDPVLIARVGGELFAVAATCTHYSGPLAEGILVGDTVRCPWHHACFSLRSGEALRAPALNPIDCWKVETSGGRIRVTGKLAPPAPRAAPANPPPSVVIVGGGAAGAAAAEQLRKEGYAGPITMLSAEPNPPVDRPNLSKDYLAGSAPEAWVTLRPPEFYREHDIALRTGVEVTALDPKSRRVTLAGGETIEYGACLLATGAEPVRLPIPGADRPTVHYLRTLADSRAIIAAAEQARRAVVVGASFIGLETAASLRARKLDVTVVAPDRTPLERVLGPELGGFVRSVHEEHGVVFRLGTKPSAIEDGAVRLDDGSSLPADLVVIGVGVKPRVALAEAAGLTLDRGVAVNELLETSAPGVFAAGDIARWPDARSGERIRVEHWVVAERQGQTAARNILGRRERFAAVPFFWSLHYDVGISYVGHAERWDRVDVAGSFAERSVTVSYRAGDRIAAMAMVYRDRQNLEAEAAMERGDRTTLERLARA
jgi:NADPH-dependent 2,4-dienoyl-CoA reductase/sulfur reductase-like enzyme/nitrite reductase/ring-hydroxylating ferredoxin subunit